jgi:hypothetical protein
MNWIRKIGLPVMVLAAALVLFNPSSADAKVRFGVTIGPAYPVYNYPYYHSYYGAPYNYAYPYTYPYSYNYVQPYGGWGYGYRGYDYDRHFDRRFDRDRHFDRHEGHERSEHRHSRR